MTTQEAKMLTAQELVQLRVKVDKTIPTKGTKEFKPSHSWLENKQIQTALDERKALLEEERVEKLGSLAKAEWDSEKKVANVTLKVGRHWKQMGHDVGGKLTLFPEEALFLLETNSLELTYNGVAMSIQQAYCTLLGSETGCTLNEYLTYLHLVRQGYTLLRHSKSIRATRYERQIRLDQHTLGQKQYKSKEDIPVQEIVIDDGSTDVKPQIQNIASKSNDAVTLENNQIVDRKSLDVGKETAPDSINNVRTNRESEVSRKQKQVENPQLEERSYLNGIITNEQSTLRRDTLNNYDTNLAGESNDSSKTQPSSNCNNVDKSSPPFQRQEVMSGSETREDITVKQCDKRTSLEVLNSEIIKSERTNKKGNESVCASDVEAVNSVNIETTAGGANKTKHNVHQNDEIISPNEETDIIIVDDSSASMDTSEKHSSFIQSEQETEYVGQADKQKKSNIVQHETQNRHGADIVDVSDNSQISQQDLIKHSDIKINFSKDSDDIEIVTLVDDKKDVDDVVEFKYNDTCTKSSFSVKAKERKCNIEVSALQSEIQTFSKKNSFTQKREEEEEGNIVKNNINQKRRKVTNIQLKQDEVDIMPNVIDLSEDDEKQNVKEEIEIVDLDDDVRSDASWETERMRILDSIPNLEGKYVMHVKIPDRSLLPPNVCPQKEDYYIHRWNVHEAGIGGRPSLEASHSRGNYTQNNSSPGTGETLSPWSPWVQFPSSQSRGGGNVYGAGGMWNNNAQSFLNPFMNPQFQPSFFGAFGMHGMFPRASNMFQNFGGPSWRANIFPPSFTPHRFRNPYVPRHWHYQRRPYYRRPYYKGKIRYESQYNTTSVGIGEQNYGNHSNNCTEVIPLKIEDEKPGVKVQTIDDDDEINDGHNYEKENYNIDDNDDDENDYIEDEDEEGDDDDVIECTSESSPVKVENDIIECTSTENEINRRKENGVGKTNIERCRKRRGSQSQRVFEPPNKLRCIIDKLKVEPKRGKNKAESQGNKGRENATDAKTWKDVKQIVILDSSSEEEEDDDDNDEEEDNGNSSDDDSDDEDIFVIDNVHRADKKKTQPLIQPEDCKDIDSVLSKLQVIKSVDFENTKDTTTDNNLKVSFDLYIPNASFRKASPGLPNYRITVFGYEEPIPEPGEFVALLKDFQDDVPLLFAVVLPDAVTFLQCGSVQLPVESFCP